MDVLEFLRYLQSLPAVRGLAAGSCVMLLLSAYHHRDRLSARGRFLLGFAAMSMAALGLAVGAAVTLTNLAAPREWDFLCFWTYGRAMALGGSPYDVELLRSLAAGQGPGEQFMEEIYCLYPPPCVVQFWPLGWLPLPAAMAVSYLVQWAALAGSVAMLWQWFDDKRTWLGLAVTLALVATLHSSASTLFFAQTNFLIVALTLLAVNASGSLRKGLWLGLALLVKPIAAILALDLIAKRQWKGLLAMAVPAAIASGAFLLLQGSHGVRAYVERNPVAEEIQAAYYTEDINQSLLATVLRLSGDAPGPRPIFHPLFIGCAAVLTALTAVTLLRLKREDDGWGSACSLALALLVYPGTLAHYSVLLFIPLALLWSKRDRLPGGAWIAIGSAAITFAFVWGKQAFLANLVVWALTITTASLPRSNGD